ncbi:MAG: L-threonylcarbamoyladenylate synthase [Victivallaceae bacterium]
MKGGYEMILNGNNLPEVAAACVKTLETPGGVVLLPTETVYGLVCAWSDSDGRDKIYRLKHRNPNKLLAMFAPDAGTAERFGTIVNPLARKLFDAFTPGGVTIICASRKGGTVGVRVPDHPLVLAVLGIIGKPLASTSANLSGTPSALNLADALRTLDGEPDLAVDGGALPEDSVASTVIDTTSGMVKILREGTVPATEIMRLF